MEYPRASPVRGAGADWIELFVPAFPLGHGTRALMSRDRQPLCASGTLLTLWGRGRRGGGENPAPRSME